LLVLGLIIGAVHPYKNALGSQTVALPDVQVLQVHQEDVPIYGEWIGTLDGLVNADVRAQATHVPSYRPLNVPRFEAGKFREHKRVSRTPTDEHNVWVHPQIALHRFAPGNVETER
jgi:hypothetical protein